MSSMRNAVQRRNHQERSQPLERQKWGLLEKHKDYSLRARDHGIKKKQLKAMRQRAADRNPDEFSFGMLSSRTNKHGSKILDRGNKPMDHDVVKLLKTQDVGYLRTSLAKVQKEREKLEGAFFVDDEDADDQRIATTKGGSYTKKHRVFVGSEEEQRNFRAEDWFGTNTEGLGKTYNRPRRPEQRAEEPSDTSKAGRGELPRKKSKQQIQKEMGEEAEAERREQLAKKKRAEGHAKLQKQLDILREREQALTQAMAEVEVQRSKMSGSLGGVNKNGVKFKIRQRKR